LNFNMKIKIIILSLFIFGCGEWGAVLVSSDYKPVLNIFGLLTQDESGSFIIVTRTANLDENINSDYYDYYNDNPANINIYSAEVYIIKEDNDSMKFELTNSNNNYYNTNQYTNDDFIPLPNTTYFLSVSDSISGLSAKGELTTPNFPQLNMMELPDTLTINKPFTLNWIPSQNNMGISIYKENNHFEEFVCINNENRYYEMNDSTDIFKLELCDYYYDAEFNNEFISSVNIQLREYDKNYFDYFVLYDEDEFMNFLIGQPGSTAKSFGIEGGLGVFGSFITVNEFKFIKSN